MRWTPDGDRRLEVLWLQANPVLSTKEIGRALGVSKNSVIGRAHRLMLPPRGSPIGARPRRGGGSDARR